MRIVSLTDLETTCWASITSPSPDGSCGLHCNDGLGGVAGAGFGAQTPPKHPTGRPVSPTQTTAKRISRGKARNDGEGDKGTEIWIGDRVLV